MQEQMIKNLFFSLPDVLISKIFRYDSTFRIFGTDKFKKELNAYWFKQRCKMCTIDVTNYITQLIDNECTWENEYGYVVHDNSKQGDFTRKMYESEKDFEVYFHPVVNGIMYFKILPKGSTNKWSKSSLFLSNPRKFDGFFCDSDADDHINSDYQYYKNICSRLTRNDATTNNEYDNLYDVSIFYDLYMWI